MKRRNPTTTVYAVDYWTEENRKNKLAAAAEKMPEPENWREKIEQGKKLRDKLRFVNEYNYILEKRRHWKQRPTNCGWRKPVERRVLYIPEEKSYITVEKEMTAEDYVDEQIGYNKKVAMAALTYIVAFAAYYAVKYFAKSKMMPLKRFITAVKT